MMKIEHIDLNLLSLLVRIYDTGSVSVAGHQLGLSQPASSNALARLRQSLGDSLFIRSKGLMVPTAFADAVVPDIRHHLAGISAVLSEASDFDPPTSERTFRLSLSGLGELTFLPPILRTILAEAPNVRLENISASVSELSRKLANREADVAIGLLEIRDSSIVSDHLFDEVYCAVCRPSRDGSEGIPEAIGSRPLIVVAPNATYGEDIEHVLSRQGLSRNIRVRIRHFGGLPEILEALDGVAIVPRQFALRLATAGQVVIMPITLPLGQPSVNLLWHRKTVQDPGCVWLRNVIVKLFRELEV